MTFEVTVGEITSSSIAYTVTPSDLKAEYLCILADAKTVESFTRDEFLVEAILEELKAEAGAQGKTLAEYMPEIVDKGAITDGKFSNVGGGEIRSSSLQAANDSANTIISAINKLNFFIRVLVKVCK